MLLIVLLCTASALASNSTTKPEFSHEGLNTLTLRGCGIGSQYWGEKIVGGSEVSIVKYPWQVSLRNVKYGGRHFCGGSLLNTRFVLTAAHCVVDEQAADLSVVLGSTRSHTMNRQARKVGVKRLLPHQKYSPSVLNDDIALIELQEEVSEATKLDFPFIRGVCLPKANEEFEGSSTVTGWGRVSEGGSSSDPLRAVDVDLMTDELCRKFYGRRKIIDGMLCAGFKEGGKDACQGDSGGPLVKAIDNRYLLIGVVSWGHGCARPNLPGVYTQVSRYVDWIEHMVSPSTTPSSTTVKPSSGWSWILGMKNETEVDQDHTTTATITG